jgi:putative membrane protein
MTSDDGTRANPDNSTMLAVERTLLAHENTLLGWIRTAISLIGFGFSIQQFFRVARANEPADLRLIGPQEFGLLMMVTGLAALILAVLQNRFDLKALRLRYPPQAGYPAIPSLARYLAALIALLGIIALLSMILRR